MGHQYLGVYRRLLDVFYITYSIKMYINRG